MAEPRPSAAMSRSPSAVPSSAKVTRTVVPCSSLAAAAARPKLIVPAGHRLEGSVLVDPEELAHEAIPSVPAGPWAAYHFPRFTPRGRPIRRGPVARTVRECLAAVETGDAVVVMCARAESYYSNPRIRYLDIDLPPVRTALVRRRSDTRKVIQDLEECAQSVAMAIRVAA